MEVIYPGTLQMFYRSPPQSRSAASEEEEEFLDQFLFFKSEFTAAASRRIFFHFGLLERIGASEDTSVYLQIQQKLDHRERCVCACAARFASKKERERKKV